MARSSDCDIMMCTRVECRSAVSLMPRLWGSGASCATWCICATEDVQQGAGVQPGADSTHTQAHRLNFPLGKKRTGADRDRAARADGPCGRDRMVGGCDGALAGGASVVRTRPHPPPGGSGRGMVGGCEARADGCGARSGAVGVCRSVTRPVPRAGGRCRWCRQRSDAARFEPRTTQDQGS
jgi:hypothetical protein